MTRQILASMCCLAVGVALAWAAPLPQRTADGHPDLQGTWSFATLTPMERPANLAGKEFFTEKEAADFEKQTIERNNKDRRERVLAPNKRRFTPMIFCIGVCCRR